MQTFCMDDSEEKDLYSVYSVVLSLLAIYYLT